MENRRDGRMAQKDFITKRINTAAGCAVQKARFRISEKSASPVKTAADVLRVCKNLQKLETNQPASRLQN